MNLLFRIIFIAFFRLTAGFQGFFWDICDLHLNFSNEDYSLGTYGNYKSDSTLRLIKTALIKMKEVRPSPEFIIVNGDNMFHGNAKFYATISAVTSEILTKFGDFNVIPTLGNHDVMPRNEITVFSQKCSSWYQLWEQCLATMEKEEIENAKKGCFYSRTIRSKTGDALVIVLNTILWYKRNKLTVNEDDPADQFKWLEQRLKFAKNMKIKAFLVGHIPPGTSEYSSFIIEHLHPKFNSRLFNIIQSNYDAIHVGIFAHEHTDAFKVVYNGTYKPVIPIFLSPSITPFYLTTIGSVNPSFRLYKWNETADASSYDQFHAILPNNSDPQTPVEFTKEYSSTEFMPGLSAENLDKLLSDFALNNSTYFDRFFSYHLSGRPHDNPSCPYDSQCRRQFICSMKHVDIEAFNLCFGRKSSSKVRMWFIIEIILTIKVILFTKFSFHD